jgi:photosystem II stability/assembly factor-like uncharacterized protein
MKKSGFSIIALISLTGLVNAQWQQTNGPYFSQIDALEASGTNIFAGPHIGNVYLSVDTGKSWNITNMPMDFSMDVEDTTLYTAVDNLVYVSKDKGVSYTTLNTGLPEGCNAYFIEVLGNVIFVNTENNGSVISTDNGVSWTPVSLGYNIGSLIQFGDSIFAGIGNGVYVSADSGLTWNLTGLEGKPVTSLLTNGKWILAGTSGYGAYRSDKKGSAWIHTDTGLPNPNITSLTMNGIDIYAGTFDGEVYVSNDDAMHWVKKSSGFPDGIYISCLAACDDNIFAGTSSCGIYATANKGALWTHSSKGLGNPADVISMAVKGEHIIAGTSLSGIYTSENNGADWTLSNLAHGIYTLVENEDTIYAGTTNGLYCSADEGLTWDQTGLPGVWITAIAIIDHMIFVGTENGVLVTEDNGLSWTEANTGIPDHTHIYCLAVKGTSIFAGSFDSGIYLSTDFGLHWSSLSSGLPYNFVRRLFVDGSSVYAGVWWNGVYVLADDGTTWTPSRLEEKCVTSFSVSGNKLLASTWQDGVFISYDHGLIWSDINEGLTNTVVESMVLDEAYIYAGIGEAGGVWKRPLSEIAGVRETEDDDELAFYPNPARNNITIESAAQIKSGIIQIYSTDGQLKTEQQLTRAKTDLNVRGLAKGIYILIIKSYDTSKMVKFVKQ